jgi:hypothetical protein
MDHYTKNQLQQVMQRLNETTEESIRASGDHKVYRFLKTEFQNTALPEQVQDEIFCRAKIRRLDMYDHKAQKAAEAEASKDGEG